MSDCYPCEWVETDAYFDALGEQLVEIFHSHNPLLARQPASASSSNDEEASMLDKLHYVAVLTADELARHHPLQCRKLLSMVFPRLSAWTCDQVNNTKKVPRAAQSPPRDLYRGHRTVRHDMVDFLAIVEATKCRQEFAQVLLEHVAPGVFASQLHVSVGRPSNVHSGDRNQRDLCERCTVTCIRLQTRASLVSVQGEAPLSRHQLLPLWRILVPHYHSFALSCELMRPPEDFNVNNCTATAAVHFVSSSDMELDASVASVPDRMPSEILRDTMFALADALICSVQRMDSVEGSINRPHVTTANRAGSPLQLSPRLFVELLREQLTVATNDRNDNWSLLIGASIVRFEAVIGPEPVLADTVRSTCAVAGLLCHTLKNLQAAEQSATAIVSLMTLLIALLGRHKKLLQAKAEASNAQKRFDNVLLKMTSAEDRDGDAHSDARRARHDRWVSDVDAEADAVRIAVRPLIPVLAALQTANTNQSTQTTTSSADVSAASRLSSAIMKVAKELHIKVITLDSAAGRVRTEQLPRHVSDPNDSRDRSSPPDVQSRSLESGSSAKEHFPRSLQQQNLCSKLRLLCTIPAVIGTSIQHCHCVCLRLVELLVRVV